MIFSNFLEFLDEKISKLKKVPFLVSDILKESFKTTFSKISKSNQNLKLSHIFGKSVYQKPKEFFISRSFSQINPKI